jgi:hypothetical protein
MDGTKPVDWKYMIDQQTQYWSADRNQFKEGLKNNNLKEGTNFWYQLGTGIKAIP